MIKISDFFTSISLLYLYYKKYTEIYGENTVILYQNGSYRIIRLSIK